MVSLTRLLPPPGWGSLKRTKRLQEEEMKTRMRYLMQEFTKQFKKAGITKEELESEIKAVRKAK